MLDRSRMVLCMAMFAFCFVNPFGSLLQPEIDYNVNPESKGRSILSFESLSYSWSDLFKLSASKLLLSSLYLLIFLLGMVKIFIYGETSVDENSTSMKKFWIHRRQTDKEMKYGKEKHEAVQKHLTLALEALGRPIPTGFFELLLSVLWQCLHQALHRLGIARWFVKRAGGFAAKKVTRKNIATNRKESAIALHQLHQVHLCTEEKDHLLGFFLAMAAVNLTEASGTNLPSNFRSHVYALLALRIRHSMPRAFNFLSR